MKTISPAYKQSVVRKVHQSSDKSWRGSFKGYTAAIIVHPPEEGKLLRTEARVQLGSARYSQLVSTPSDAVDAITRAIILYEGRAVAIDVE